MASADDSIFLQCKFIGRVYYFFFHFLRISVFVLHLCTFYSTIITGTTWKIEQLPTPDEPTERNSLPDTTADVKKAGQ